MSLPQMAVAYQAPSRSFLAPPWMSLLRRGLVHGQRRGDLSFPYFAHVQPI